MSSKNMSYKMFCQFIHFFGSLPSSFFSTSFPTLFKFFIVVLIDFFISFIIKLMFTPAYFFVLPEHGYYLFPIDNSNSSAFGSSNLSSGHQKDQTQELKQQKKLKIYLQKYREQIEKLRQNTIKKCWNEKQDEYLLNLKDDNIDWEQISKIFPQTNAAICKRRFYRLRQQLNKWPRELDSQIRRLFQEQKLAWSEIRRIINENISKTLKLPKFSTNKIKQRYTLYLKPGISKDQWTVDQDIQLIKLIKQSGKQWTRVIKNNPILEGRTELQLKNRYFGTLKFLEKKVLRKTAIHLKQLNIDGIQK